MCSTAHLFCAVMLSVMSVSKSEFSIYQEQTLRPWTTYYSADSDECSPTGLLTAFPHIYNIHGHFRLNIDPVRSFTVTQIEREALELGGSQNFYYPGAIVSLLPPENGFQHVTGYEIVFIRNKKKNCIVLDFTNRRWSREGRIEFELFPLNGLSHYQVSVSTLPKYRQEQTSPVQHLVTSQFGRYQYDNEPLESPASWFAAVSYYITEEILENSTRHSVEVVFSRPPVEYNFNQFEIALVSTTNGAGIWNAVTSNFYHVFEDVPEGSYKIMLWPKDEYFSQPGRCLCLANGACSNCVTTAVETVTVS